MILAHSFQCITFLHHRHGLKKKVFCSVAGFSLRQCNQSCVTYGGHLVWVHFKELVLGWLKADFSLCWVGVVKGLMWFLTHMINVSLCNDDQS